MPVDRGICCHVGGNIDFDGTGNLFLSTGDDTNPFSSDGYTPIDDTPNRNPAFDARRSAGNTNDLRGKILRIHPKDGGGYTIPLGQPVPAGHGEDQARDLRDGPAQPVPLRGQPHERRPLRRRLLAGRRPPTRSAARPATAAGCWSSAGQLRLAVLRDADMPYMDYDFATKTSGEAFNCNAPTNDSPYNTGLKRLPAVTQPGRLVLVRRVAAVPGARGRRAPGGIAPMGGPAYDPKPDNSSPFRFPNYYKGEPLFYEWSRDYIKEFRLNSRRLAEIGCSASLRGQPDRHGVRPGRLALRARVRRRLLRREPGRAAGEDQLRARQPHAGGRRSRPTPAAGRAPRRSVLECRDHGPGRRPSRSPGTSTATARSTRRAANPTLTYRKNGTYRATLKVTDRTGRSASAEAPVLVGNQPPEIELVKRRGEENRSSSGTRSPTRSRSPTTRRWTARRSASPSCSARAARPPAVVDHGLHRLEHDGAGHRPRRRGEPERRVRRLLHGPGGRTPA